MAAATRFDLADDFTDPELERGVIAAVARAPELYWLLVDRLPTDAFVAEADAWTELTAAIESDQGVPLMPLETCRFGPEPVPWMPSEDPERDAEQLGDLLQRRLLAAAAQRLGQALYDRERPARDVAMLLEEEAARAQAAIRETSAGQAVALPELFSAVLANVRAQQQALRDNPGGVVGIPTGIPTYDKLLGGLQPGLHVMAAEPGQGKTTLTVEIGAHAARKGYPVLFVTFEETPERLALKALCQLGELDAKAFSEGRGDPERLARVIEAHATTLAPFRIVEGSARLTVSMVRAKAMAAMAKHRTSRCLIVVDYVQRWAAGRREFTDFRHVVAGLVGELRELALRLSSPVIAICSQNRNGQGGAALTSLKESGDLEYSADSVAFLVTDEDRLLVSPLRAVNLTVRKNRYGDTGVAKLIFRPDVGRMHEQDGRW